jgi:hypothetical protein
MVYSSIHFSSFRQKTSQWSLMVLASKITFVSCSTCSTTPSFLSLIIVCNYVILLFFLDGIEIFWLINSFMRWFVSNKRFLWREVVMVLLISIFTFSLNLTHYNFFLFEDFLQFGDIFCKFEFLFVKLTFHIYHLAMYEIKIVPKLIYIHRF